MKLITTIFPADEIEILLTVQSRATRNTKEAPSNEPLITRYKSKIGNESLIFNPSIAIILRNRASRDTPDALIPVNLIYRFTASLSHVYQKLQTEKLYHSDGSALYVDQKLALSNSRKISLFRNSLTITPGVSSDRTGKLVKGVTFNIEGNPVGTMSHAEVLGLLDILDHLDISTFSLLAGVVDELEGMNRKMDLVLNKLGNIESLLLGMKTGGTTAHPPVREQFQWQILDTGMF